jgi:hypothetical protein
MTGTGCGKQKVGAMNIKDATRLVNGEPAPGWIAELNGSCVEDIAEEIERRNKESQSCQSPVEVVSYFLA